MENASTKYGGFAGAGLRLRDRVTPFQNGHDSPCLDGGWLLKAICKDAAEQLVFETHLVERRDDLHIFGRVEREGRFSLERLRAARRRHWAARWSASMLLRAA